jgi:cell wall-associated NlpC family hydrolase
MNGVKVKMVQRRLGFPADTWETVDDPTVAAARRFQQRAGLVPDGVVGPETWRAMGFSEDFCFDRYQAEPALPATATAQERREQMIAFANAFLGEEYVWGGAGPRGYGSIVPAWYSKRCTRRAWIRGQSRSTSTCCPITAPAASCTVTRGWPTYLDPPLAGGTWSSGAATRLVW